MTDTQETQTASAPETRVNDWANKYGVTAGFEFVPFSLSRNAGEKSPSLNWKVTLYKDQREFLRCDYMQGCAHAPSYKPNIKYQVEADALKAECETGRKVREIAGLFRPVGTIDKPKLTDVLYSIVNDADAINYGTFEDWASEFGYDKDSREAEAIYKTCLEHGLKLRSVVGDKALNELNKAMQDY